MVAAANSTSHADSTKRKRATLKAAGTPFVRRAVGDGGAVKTCQTVSTSPAGEKTRMEALRVPPAPVAIYQDLGRHARIRLNSRRACDWCRYGER